jgi:hypothetical protein
MGNELAGPTPSCCGRDMTLIRAGRCANFVIWLWRCPHCERFQTTSRRYDGETFWVGAMGDALLAEISTLIADAYRDEQRRAQ